MSLGKNIQKNELVVSHAQVLKKSRTVEKGAPRTRPSQLVGIVLGLGIIVASIGAAMSGEPATKTNTGVISIAFGIIFGIFMIASNASGGKKKSSAGAQPVLGPSGTTSPASPLLARCPRCGKEVAEDYVACPYCGLTLKVKCPSCGKELKPEFIVCPFCRTSLK